MSESRSDLSKNIASLLESKPRKIDEGITDVVVEQTFDDKGVPIRTTSTYTQHGMRHWDIITEPGIQVPKNKYVGD